MTTVEETTTMLATRPEPDGVLAELATVWTRTMTAPALLSDYPVDPDIAINQLMALEALKTRLAEMAKLVERVRQEYGLAQVERHGKQLFPYYAGTEKTEKCRDVRKLLEHLLAVTDMETLSALLSSSAWKPGACKTVLGESWADHFEVTEGPKLKESEGKRAEAFKLMKASQFALR